MFCAPAILVLALGASAHQEDPLYYSDCKYICPRIFAPITLKSQYHYLVANALAAKLAEAPAFAFPEGFLVNGTGTVGRRYKNVEVTWTQTLGDDSTMSLDMEVPKQKYEELFNEELQVNDMFCSHENDTTLKADTYDCIATQATYCPWAAEKFVLWKNVILDDGETPSSWMKAYYDCHCEGSCGSVTSSTTAPASAATALAMMAALVPYMA
jgi:hypothetical protein